jgi:hypothetical protein
MDTSKLEQLIDQYESAIFKEDVKLMTSLSIKVEKEADRIGYTNHRRLMSLHTMAENAVIVFDRKAAAKQAVEAFNRRRR